MTSDENWPNAARRRVQASPLSKREIIRRLGTSATQFYRLLDQANYRKSIDQLLPLLHVLDCDVDLVVRATPGRATRQSCLSPIIFSIRVFTRPHPSWTYIPILLFDVFSLRTAQGTA